jgi:hypothetical protein
MDEQKISRGTIDFLDAGIDSVLIPFPDIVLTQSRQRMSHEMRGVKFDSSQERGIFAFPMKPSFAILERRMSDKNISLIWEKLSVK